MKNQGLANRVRIIGGFWRSRILHVIDQPGLRPTQDRVRETLFNWLTPYLFGASCLDTFAGSGVLGLEAGSRGARFVQLIEFSQKAYLNIKENIKNLQPAPEGCQIDLVRDDAIHWLKHHDLSQFDVIFVDPPFEDTILLQNTLKIIGSVKFQTNCPIIYVESSTKVEDSDILQNLGNWQIERQMMAGVVKASLLKLKT